MSVRDGLVALRRDPGLPKFVDAYLLACRAEAKSPEHDPLVRAET